MNVNLVGPCADRRKLKLTNGVSGNLGPGMEGMRFSRITWVDGKAVDMIVKADENYQANNASVNGVNGSIMTINLADNVTTLVNFSFVDAETNEPISLSRFEFMLLDIDQTLHGFEEVILNNADNAHHWTSVNSSVQVNETGKVVKFKSSEWGDASDNSLAPFGLTASQARKTAIFWIDEPVSYVSLTLRTYNIYTGRNFRFSTNSDLVCPAFADEPKLPCDDFTDLEFGGEELFSNNLGGEKNDEPKEIRVGGVASVNGTTVDMVITASDSYRAHNASESGVKGNLVQVNLADNVTTDVTFGFINRSSDEPIALKRVFMTILDLDGTRHGFEAVSVRSSLYTKYVRHSNSSVLVTQEKGKTKFKSTKFGTRWNNPVNRHKLTESHGNMGVALYFEEPVSEVTFTLQTKRTWTGRNIQFAGVTNIACPNLPRI